MESACTKVDRKSREFTGREEEHLGTLIGLGFEAKRPPIRATEQQSAARERLCVTPKLIKKLRLLTLVFLGALLFMMCSNLGMPRFVSTLLIRAYSPAQQSYIHPLLVPVKCAPSAPKVSR